MFTYSPFYYAIDMVFDEDAILLSFFNRFSEPDEEEDLKTEVIRYVSGGNFGGPNPMEEEMETTGESIEDVSTKTITPFVNLCKYTYRCRAQWTPESTTRERRGCRHSSLQRSRRRRRQ